jgi:ABC-type transport system involved in cytochrome bd biosynthesis fused ATPase/permease subunit
VIENVAEDEHYIGDYDTAPAFMKDNLGITHGYRINFNNPKKILRSLFMVHNESVNIWSHCLPAIIISIFLLSFVFFIDAEAMRRSMAQCQEQIQRGVDHYMHALDNLSLIAEYDTFTKRTKDEMEELKQSVMKNYQEFTTKFQESSNHFQNLVESEV